MFVPSIAQPVAHALTKRHDSSEDGTRRGVPIVIDRASFNQGQNAQYLANIAESEVMPSLIARGPHAVFPSKIPAVGTDCYNGAIPVAQPTWYASDGQANAAFSKNLSLTITATNEQGYIAQPVASTLGNRGVRYTELDGHGAYMPVAQPLPFDTTQLSSPANRSSPKAGDPCHPLAAAAHAPAVATAMQVRRLTPTECERLQGFPDGYTNIPWRKKAAEECPDGPRYKALGNSMAVNCMAWIGQRIAQADKT